MSFPYIQKLIVNDCYAYQNLTIDTGVQEEGQFKHIILTGPNGSGKTTILESILSTLKNYTIPITFDEIQKGVDLIVKDEISAIAVIENKKVYKISSMVSVFFTNYKGKNFNFLLSFHKSKRNIYFENIESVTNENLQININNFENEEFAKKLKQYIVNKKIFQAFDIISSKNNEVSQSQRFFSTFTDSLRKIFQNPKLELEFEQEKFEFYLNFSNGRRVTFNQLSDGFSAFISIIMDLLMRTDLIRKEKGDYSYDPEGFVLIDEPETHLHLSMQYEVLPLINALFPRLQLIVATHSPAVISSLKNAVVYDLGSQKTVSSDELVASSFSELMVRHFGLDNEFSNIADEILKQAGDALKAKDPARLREVLAANERYLTPSLRLELESQLILLQNRMPA